MREGGCMCVRVRDCVCGVKYFIIQEERGLKED